MRTKQERTNNPGKKSFEMDFKVSLQMKLFNALDNRYSITQYEKQLTI